MSNDSSLFEELIIALTSFQILFIGISQKKKKRNEKENKGE